VKDPFEGLPEALRAIRKRKGWSQSFWSKRAGISPSIISRYELGKIDPTVGTLGKLLDAAEMSLEELCEVLRVVRQEPPRMKHPEPDLADSLVAKLTPQEESLAHEVIRLVMRQRELHME